MGLLGRNKGAPPGQAKGWRRFGDCLPGFLSRRKPPYRLRLEGDQARLERNGRQLAQLNLEGLDPASRALLSSRDAPLVLMVPTDWLLARDISLPAAAAENLRQVLSFELDRFTPFKAEQVYLDYRVNSASDESGMLSLTLVVLPRQRIEPWLGLLRSAGVKVDGIAADGFWPEMNLLPPEDRPRPGLGRLLWRALPLFLVVALALALLALPLWQKRKVAIDLQSREARLRGQANQVLDLRERLESKRQELQTVAEQWRTAPPVLDVLMLLTRLLPDDTYLQQLNLKGRELTIRGLSGQASALIALLEASPAFEGPHFLSPVTQQRGKELFHLAATLRQPFPAEALEQARAASPPPPAPEAPRQADKGAAGNRAASAAAPSQEKQGVAPQPAPAAPPSKEKQGAAPRPVPAAPTPAGGPAPTYPAPSTPPVQRILSGGGG